MSIIFQRIDCLQAVYLPFDFVFTLSLLHVMNEKEYIGALVHCA